MAAAGSGLLQFLAFPPAGLGLVSFVALVPLFWAAFAPRSADEPPLTFRRQFLIGFVAQAVYFVSLLHWILYLSNDEVTVPGLMIPALLFMSGYLAVFFALAVAISGTMERSGGPAAAATLPVFWTLFDWLRSSGTLAFPWGSLGYSLAPLPAWLQISAWTGFWGLTFWIVAVNGLLSWALLAWQRGGRGPAWKAAAAAVILFSVPALHGTALLRSAPRETGDSPEGLKLALVQANTSREIKWKEGFEGVVVEDLLRRTREAAARDPGLIVWPETAAPLMILWDPELAALVRDTVDEIDRWVLVGTLDAVRGKGSDYDEYNAAVLYGPDGVPSQRYYKTRLVPFSEAMPFQKQIPWINALNLGQSNFSSGKEKNLFVTLGWRYSCLICFESIFPDLSRHAVAGGAQYLINTTNDFWFGRSAGPVQHADMAIHRAVENRTPLARCANSGISFFVDPFGRVFGRTGLFVDALPVARMAPGSGGSFYTRHGDWIVWSLALLGAVSLALTVSAGGIRRRERRRGNEQDVRTA